MKTNPGQLSLAFAFFTAVLIFAGAYLLQYFFFETPDLLYSIVLTALVAPLVYFAFRTALDRFIYDKIKVIYKTIRKSKTGLSTKNNKIKGDILEEVNREVEQWAANQEKEIAALKSLEAYRREFLGNVSHELKTPITTIQGYVLTLLDGGLEDPNVNKKYLMRTAKSINRMISIVNDLDTISRFEAGAIELRNQRFNFTLSVLEVFDFMEMKAHKRKINLVFKGNPETPCFVMGDKEKIRQVLINLIDNSLKYGNNAGTTSVSIFDMDDHVLIEVTDDGIGIDESDLLRVFERFYRTEKSRTRSQGGSGLGLAIVKHIIEAHKQTIHVRSKVNVGSTFAFTLKKA
jgi:two-component system phosphate regulon sensor histidine kinase PhoR